MEWAILAVVSWILFFLLIDWSTLKKHVWCGLFAVIIQLLVDNTGVSHGFYEIHKCKFCIAHSSFLYTFGPVFTVGVLMAQYHPSKRLFRILHVVSLAVLHTCLEIVLLIRGNVVYKNWHFADSVGVNFSVMAILCWFAIVVLRKNERQSE